MSLHHFNAYRSVSQQLSGLGSAKKLGKFMARHLQLKLGMTLCTIAIMMLALALGPPAAPAKGDHAVPPITEVQLKAIGHARLEPSEISSWKKRARMQAFLPQLQVEYERRTRSLIDIGINDSVYVGSNGVVVGPEEGNYSYNNNADQNVAVKAVWSLNETVFNPDMLNVSAEARRLAENRQMILAEVTKNYFERERLAGEIEYLEGEIRKSPEPEKIRHEIFLKGVSIKEATAGLDALTGGWFSEKIREDSRVAKGR